MPKRKRTERLCTETAADKRRRITTANTLEPLRRSSRLQEAPRRPHAHKTKLQQVPSPELSNSYSRSGDPEREQKQSRNDSLEGAEACLEKPCVVQCYSISKEKNVYNPIAYWVKKSYWPPSFAEKGFNMNDSSSSSAHKRVRTSSYSQSVRVREAPEQYTSAYELWIATKGLDMDPLEGEERVSKESKKFCGELLKMNRKRIQPILIPQDATRKLLNSLRHQNEAKVQRDATPLILPPISALRHHGTESLEHVGDEVNANWGEQCVLAGPRIRPDLAVGLLSSAFTQAEIDKLNVYTSPDNWTKVTAELYFPFILCEVKCGEGGLNVADRQNMHSSSVAARAILRLVQEADRYRTIKQADNLKGEILTFSFSHDESNVQFYGHFAIPRHGDWSYYRYRIKRFDILTEEDALLGAFNFVQNILECYYPLHLKRLKDALADLPEPTTLSYSASAMSLSNDSSLIRQSQDANVFKKPIRSASSVQNETILKLTEQLEQQREESKQQREESRRQLEQQREESRRQLEQQKQFMEEHMNHHQTQQLREMFSSRSTK